MVKVDRFTLCYFATIRSKREKQGRRDPAGTGYPLGRGGVVSREQRVPGTSSDTIYQLLRFRYQLHH